MQSPETQPAVPAEAPPRRRRRLHFFTRHYGRKLADRLEEVLPSYAVGDLRQALAGDPEAAEALCGASAPNEYRGYCVLALYLNEVPTPCLHAGLWAAWEHDHAEVWYAFKHPKRLAAAFRAAEFPLPDPPPVVTIWRGGHGLAPSLLRRGPSWTLDRDVACWFAVTYRRPDGASPVVLRAEVPREKIFAYSDGRGEREVVVLGVQRAEVCGTPDDWLAGAARHSQRIAESNAQVMARLAVPADEEAAA